MCSFEQAFEACICERAGSVLRPGEDDERHDMGSAQAPQQIRPASGTPSKARVSGAADTAVPMRTSGRCVASQRSTAQYPTNRYRAQGQPTRLALRITKRGRLALFVVSSLTIVVAVISTGQLAGASAVPAANVTVLDAVQVVVQPGDSLWGLARSSLPNADPRETVRRIRELNGLSGSVINPGEVIWLPTTP